MATIFLVASALVASLLFTATIIALAGRVSSRLGQWALAALAVVVPPLPVLFLAVVFALLFAHHHWFASQATLAIVVCVVLLVAGVVLLRRGFRRIDNGPMLAARSWPAAKLALAFVVALTAAAMARGISVNSARIEAADLMRQASIDLAMTAPARLPESMNAYPLCKQAYDALEQSPIKQALDSPAFNQLRDPSQSPDAATLEEVRAALQPHLPALELLHQAAKLPGYAMDIDYARLSSAVLLTDASPSRLAARMLQAHALLSAREGDSRAALRDVQTMARLARHIGQTPFIISALVATAIDALAVSTLEQVLAIAPPAADDLRDFDLGAAPGDSRSLIDAVRIEHTMVVSDVTRSLLARYSPPAELLPENARVGLRLNWALDPIVAVALIGDYAAMSDHFVATLRLPVSQQDRALEQLNRDVEQGSLLVRIAFPALNRAVQTINIGRQSRDLANIALAVVRYRLEHHRNPAGLDDLAPSYLGGMPRDLFADTPLLLLVRDDGAIALYSVGPDGVDDHATPYDRKANTGDIVFTLPPLPAPKPQ